MFLTGEPAEEVVGHLPGISEQAIEEHEEAAEVAAIVTGFAGLLGLWLLIARRGGRHRHRHGCWRQHSSSHWSRPGCWREPPTWAATSGIRRLLAAPQSSRPLATHRGPVR